MDLGAFLISGISEKFVNFHSFICFFILKVKNTERKGNYIMAEKLKNPKECFSIVKRQTFFILNELTLPEFKDGSEPLTFHHERFSRFVFVSINEAKKAATANLPVRNAISILEKSKLLAKLEYEESFKSKENNEECSAAYTTTINAGTLKGKTPASALAESPENVQLLIKQVEWLKSNLVRYPKNQVQINAINSALDLYRKGMLNKDAAGSRKNVIMYESGLRPLTRKVRKDGRSFVYEFRIYWDIGSENPVRVDIRNFYAPVEKTEQGLLNVKVREKDMSSEVHNVFAMSLDEWIWAVHILDTNIRTFENRHARQCYDVAEEANKINRINAGVLYN